MGKATYLIHVDSGVQIIPFFDLHSEDIVDAQALQPVDGQWSRQVRDQHVMLAELLED